MHFTFDTYWANSSGFLLDINPKCQGDLHEIKDNTVFDVKVRLVVLLYLTLIFLHFEV